MHISAQAQDALVVRVVGIKGQGHQPVFLHQLDLCSGGVGYHVAVFVFFLANDFKGSFVLARVALDLHVVGHIADREVVGAAQVQGIPGVEGVAFAGHPVFVDDGLLAKNITGGNHKVGAVPGFELAQLRLLLDERGRGGGECGQGLLAGKTVFHGLAQVGVKLLATQPVHG